MTAFEDADVKRMSDDDSCQTSVEEVSPMYSDMAATAANAAPAYGSQGPHPNARYLLRSADRHHHHNHTHHHRHQFNRQYGMMVPEERVSRLHEHRRGLVALFVETPRLHSIAPLSPLSPRLPQSINWRRKSTEEDPARDSSDPPAQQR